MSPLPDKNKWQFGCATGLQTIFQSINLPNKPIWCLFLWYFQKALFKISPQISRDVKDLQTPFTSVTATLLRMPEYRKETCGINMIGRPLRSPAPNKANLRDPISKVNQTAWGHIQSCSEHIQEQSVHNHSIPVLVHLHSQSYFSNIWSESRCFNSCPFTVWFQEDSGSITFLPLYQIAQDSN